MKKTTKKGMGLGKMVAIGASAVAAGGAAYYLLGPNAKKHQKNAKKWAMEAKNKIVTGLVEVEGKAKKAVSRIKKEIKKKGR